WYGRHVQAVHGPEDLSFREVAAVLGEALDRSVAVRQVSDDDVRAELRAAGPTPQQVASIVDMTAGIRDGFVPENPPRVHHDDTDHAGRLGPHPTDGRLRCVTRDGDLRKEPHSPRKHCRGPYDHVVTDSEHPESALWDTVLDTVRSHGPMTID